MISFVSKIFRELLKIKSEPIRDYQTYLKWALVAVWLGTTIVDRYVDSPVVTEVKNVSGGLIECPCDTGADGGVK